jgi:hypothetical protein
MYYKSLADTPEWYRKNLQTWWREQDHSLDAEEAQQYSSANRSESKVDQET